MGLAGIIHKLMNFDIRQVSLGRKIIAYSCLAGLSAMFPSCGNGNEEQDNHNQEQGNEQAENGNIHDGEGNPEGVPNREFDECKLAFFLGDGLVVANLLESNLAWEAFAWTGIDISPYKEPREDFNDLLVSSSPAWLPDGKHVVLSLDKELVRGTETSLYSVPIEEGEIDDLIFLGGDFMERQPAVSPRGNIAYVNTRVHRNYQYGNIDSYGSSDIFVMINTENDRFQMNLTNYLMSEETPCCPQWTPDEKKIIFAKRTYETDAAYALFSVTVPPNDMRQARNFEPIVERISEGISKAYPDISLSPDGKKVLYVSDENDIWMMNIDGTDRVQLTDTESYRERDPAWMPDMKSVVFSAGNANIYSLSLESGTLKEIVKDPESRYPTNPNKYLTEPAVFCR